MDTIELPPDLSEFLRLLNAKSVEYLVIGGYAVVFHGYPRLTGDLDVQVAVNPCNAERLVDGQYVPVIALADRKANKAAGRAKDLEDLEHLG